VEQPDSNTVECRMTALTDWESFYVIVGSCAGALIGLQFVVITIVADKKIPTTELTHGALATPTIVHFSVVLLLAALVSAPWNGFLMPAILWTLIAVGGIAYTAVVRRRLFKQEEYDPIPEDWLFRTVLPFGAYCLLAFSALATLLNHSTGGLFGIGASSLMLLFVGIHDAWDSIVYLVTQK
jgi:hypothetical protein